MSSVDLFSRLEGLSPQERLNFLQEKAIRLQLILDNIGDIICFKDAEGRWLEANRFDLELFELEDVDYFGKKDSELAEYSPFYRDAFLTCEKSDEEAWRKGKESRTIEIIPKRDGSVKIFDVRKIPFFHEDGSRKGLFVYGRDITEQELLKKELERTITLHEKAQSIAKLGHWFWNISENTLEWSDEVYRIFELDREKVKPSYELFLSFVHPDDRDAVIEAVNRSLKSGEKYSIEHRILLPNNRVKYLHEEGEVTFDENGKPISMIGVVQDVTLFSLLINQLELISELFNNSLEGIIVTDEKSRIIMANAAAAKITGYELQELIGQKTSILKSERHDKKFYEQMWESLKKEGKWTGEIWNRRKNGEIYPEILSIITIKDQRGQIKYYASIFYDLTEIKAKEEKIKISENYDHLTGLPNQKFFFNRLDELIGKYKQSGKGFYILNIDLDNFKKINDSFTYAQGDQILLVLSNRLKKYLGKQNFLARISADNFVLIFLDETDLVSLTELVSELLQDVSKPLIVDQIEVFVTASVGIALFPHDGDNSQSLFKASELAMYEAKRKGGNTYHFYTQGLFDNVKESIYVESSLRNALKENAFVLYYQPRINVKKNTITSLEALIRMVSPEGEIIPPGKFIPYAEKSGLIIPIGYWVLKNTCLQMKKWYDRGLRDLRISCNLSPRQFKDDELLKNIIEILRETKVNPNNIELEITESALVENEEDAIITLNSLKKLGIKISIDDFGTGYSSFYYLNKLPIDSIKIDRVFIKDYPEDTKTLGIISAMMEMARHLGLNVIVEGVEKRDQVELLMRLNCDEIQGFFFSPPVPVDKIEVILRDGIRAISSVG